MKMSIVKLGKGLVILASATFLFACASTGSSDNIDTTPVVVEPEVVIEEPAGPTPEELAITANNEMRQARTVYFALDDDTVTSDARALLEAHAWYLTKNANTVITVDGHCDERGTPAYNLALGERRAKAIAQVLMLNGVSASQIKTVSHGEEMPAAMGHDESSWSKNRRGELSYEG
jgi:peptidoglycan-associated lipoprotein